MPNREQRRSGATDLGKWLHVEDAEGTPYDIYLRDITGRDEFDFMTMTQGQMGGLCDLFLEQKVTLVGVAGLIWCARRKFEKKLTVMDVLKMVNMETIESMELHDPEEEGDAALESLPADDPNRKLAEMRAAADQSVGHESGEGLPGFGGGSGPSGPDSEPSTG